MMRHRSSAMPVAINRKIYLAFFYNAFVLQLPWNSIISLKSYFDAVFACNSKLEEYYMSAFTVDTMGPILIGQILSLCFVRKGASVVGLGSCVLLVLVGILGLVIVLKVHIHFSCTAHFSAVLLILMVINLACAVAQNMLFGMAAAIHEKYSQALMCGQGLGGTYAGIIGVVLIALKLNDETMALVVYTGMLLLTAMAFFSFRYIVRNAQPQHMFAIVEDRSDPDEVSIVSDVTVVDEFEQSYASAYVRVFPTLLAVMLAFMTTLSLFPSMTSMIVPFGNISKGSFGIIANLLVFKTGDFLGRAGPLLYMVTRRPGIILLTSVIRLGYIALVLVCNVQPRQDRLPVIIRNDYAALVVILSLGLTGGYLGTLGMMVGPTLVHPASTERAGRVMSVGMATGLTMGGLLSILLSWMMATKF